MVKVKMYGKNHKKVNEDGEGNMGGVSAPMSTLNNTPGVGNAVPASAAGMTLGQQMSDTTKGSGDAFGTVNKKDKNK